jgi:hypothetical protein
MKMHIRYSVNALLLGGVLAFAVTYVHAFGELDQSFNSTGAFTDYDLEYDAFAMARQSDGKIVAVGTRYDTDWNYWELVVKRYLANGGVDTSFGWNGRALSYDVRGWGVDVAIRADGKIVVVGGAPPIQYYPTATAVWVFNSNGTYDANFGSFGRTQTWGNGFCDVAPFKPSKIAAEEMIIGCSSGELFRMRSNATINASFGSGGLVNTGSMATFTVRWGNIYVIGGQTIKKYSVLGVADQSFGAAGVFSQSADYCCVPQTPAAGSYRFIDLKNAGNLVVVGTASFYYGAYTTLHLSSHQSNGSFDASYAGVPCPGSSDLSQANLYGGVSVDSADRAIIATFNKVERRQANGSYDDSYPLSTYQTIMDVEVLPDNRILTLSQRQSSGVKRARFDRRMP